MDLHLNCSAANGGNRIFPQRSLLVLMIKPIVKVKVIRIELHFSPKTLLS